MVKSLVILITVSLAYLVLGSEKKDLSSLTKNAIYTNRLLRVEIEMKLYTLIQSKLSGVKDDEIKTCINKVKDNAVTESNQILNDSIGSVLTELTDAGKKLADGEKEQVQSWLDQYDYEAKKANAKKQFTENVQTLLPKVEAQLEQCDKKE